MGHDLQLLHGLTWSKGSLGQIYKDLWRPDFIYAINYAKPARTHAKDFVTHLCRKEVEKTKLK